MLSLHAQFGVDECFSTGDEMGVLQYEVDLLVGEVLMVVVMVMGVVNIVGVVAAQGEHSEECNIEEGTLAQVVGEVVVRRVAEKEPEVVPALELVGGEAAFGDMHLKGLLMGLRCRKVLHTLFWQPLPRCLFFFSSSLTFPCFHGLPCCWFFFFFFFINVGDTGDTGVVDVAVVFAIVGVCGTFLVAGVGLGVVDCSVVAAAGSGAFVCF